MTKGSKVYGILSIGFNGLWFMNHMEKMPRVRLPQYCQLPEFKHESCSIWCVFKAAGVMFGRVSAGTPGLM